MAETLTSLRHCADLFAYRRRKTRAVMVGRVGVGGGHPIRVQSMTTTDTLDVEATILQSIRMAEAGCELVRITAPTVNDARALGEIKKGLLKRGVLVPLVADIHFSPQAAMEAAEFVEKVRINPGNFVDTKRFDVKEYTDLEYEAETLRIEERFTPLVAKLKRLGRAMRIGTNHGSLSDRIMNRYGDSALGMVESALEFVRICEKNDYRDIILSMKASNPKVMIAAYRLLAARMSELGMDYPFHLGVTEAGDGEDGRIKSAIGIGSLLADGIGDTIRVSLTEAPELEIPVCRELARPFHARAPQAASGDERLHCADLFSYSRRKTSHLTAGPIMVGGQQLVRVVTAEESPAVLLAKLEAGVKKDTVPEIVIGKGFKSVLKDQTSRLAFDGEDLLIGRDLLVIDGISDPVLLIQAYRKLAVDNPGRPILLRAPWSDVLQASLFLGSLLCDGVGDAVQVQGASLETVYNILQGAGVRITKTEFVSCPSCGRTLFNLQETTERIKKQTGHLKGVKIAIMGCIVNGPGEMADADFGYVGGAPDKINLYVGKDCVQKGIPSATAVQALITLIKAHGKWVEAA